MAIHCFIYERVVRLSRVAHASPQPYSGEGGDFQTQQPQYHVRPEQLAQISGHVLDADSTDQVLSWLASAARSLSTHKTNPRRRLETNHATSMFRAFPAFRDPEGFAAVKRRVSNSILGQERRAYKDVSSGPNVPALLRLRERTQAGSWILFLLVQSSLGSLCEKGIVQFHGLCWTLQSSHVTHTLLFFFFVFLFLSFLFFLFLF